MTMIVRLGGMTKMKMNSPSIHLMQEKVLMFRHLSLAPSGTLER